MPERRFVVLSLVQDEVVDGFASLLSGYKLKSINCLQDVGLSNV